MLALLLLRHIAAAEPHATSPTALQTHAHRVFAQTVMFTHQLLESFFFFFRLFVCGQMLLEQAPLLYRLFNQGGIPRSINKLHSVSVSEVKLISKMFHNTGRREREKKIVFREGSCPDICVFFFFLRFCPFFLSVLSMMPRDGDTGASVSKFNCRVREWWSA